MEIGMVYTPMMHGTSGMSQAEREARKNRSLLRTEGNGWDVGAAVRFLASDQSRWMTGKDGSTRPVLAASTNMSCNIGVILPLDAGATCATGVGSPSLHDSTSAVEGSTA